MLYVLYFSQNRKDLFKMSYHFSDCFVTMDTASVILQLLLTWDKGVDIYEHKICLIMNPENSHADFLQTIPLTKKIALFLA